jgi:hypothetical protein
MKALNGRARRVDPDPVGSGSGSKISILLGPGPDPKILDPTGSTQWKYDSSYFSKNFKDTFEFTRISIWTAIIQKLDKWLSID